MDDLQDFGEFYRALQSPHPTTNLTQPEILVKEDEPFSENNFRFWFEDIDLSFLQNMQTEHNSEISQHFDTSSVLPNHNTTLAFNPWVLEMVNFEIPTSRSELIDTSIYVNRATVEYGEEFAKRVEKNLRILVEIMKKTSECCGGVERGVCCNGECWGYVESRWRAMHSISNCRGRKKKGLTISAEERRLKKEYQKIKNRVAATRSYYKEKNYIRNLEAQVRNLRTENKIRRNLVKFLESNLERTTEKRSRGRAMSRPLNFTAGSYEC